MDLENNYHLPSDWVVSIHFFPLLSTSISIAVGKYFFYLSEMVSLWCIGFHDNCEIWLGMCFREVCPWHVIYEIRHIPDLQYWTFTQQKFSPGRSSHVRAKRSCCVSLSGLSIPDLRGMMYGLISATGSPHLLRTYFSQVRKLLYSTLLQGQWHRCRFKTKV